MADWPVNHKDQHWAPSTGLFPRLINLLVANWFNGPLSPWKEKPFNLIVINLYPGYESAFPVHSALASTTVEGADLSACNPYYSAVNQDPLYGKWSVWLPYHSEAAGLTECWNGLLKVHLRLNDDTWWGYGDSMVLCPQQAEYMHLVIKE